MITLTYDVSTFQDPAVVAAKVAAVAFDQSQLDLIGATVFSDTTVIVGSVIRRTVVLDFTAAGLANFPTATEQIAATIDLYKNVLATMTPAVVIAAQPVVT